MLNIFYNYNTTTPTSMHMVNFLVKHPRYDTKNTKNSEKCTKIRKFYPTICVTPNKTSVLTDRDHHDIVQRPSLPRRWGLS